MNKILVSLLLLVNFIYGATVEVELLPTKPNGKDWDGFGGKPDIYIVVNGTSYREHRCQDSFKCSIEIRGEYLEDDIVIEVWDADVADDDLAGEFTLRVGQKVKNESVEILYINELSVLSDMLDEM